MNRQYSHFYLTKSEIREVLLEQVTSFPSAIPNDRGRILMINDGVEPSEPAWWDGSAWERVHRTFRPASHPSGARAGWIYSSDGLSAEINITGTAGSATVAGGFASPVLLALDGKAGSSTATLQNGGAVIGIHVTTLSVDPVDIALASGRMLVGSGAGKAVSSPFSALRLDQWGAPVVDVAFGGRRITNLADPQLYTDAATKNYVDLKTSGLAPTTPMRLATTAALPSYTPVGNVLTMDATGVLTIDGKTAALNDRVLVKNESGANQKYNGPYYVSTAGAVGVAAVLTRPGDYDSSPEMITGTVHFISDGSTLAATKWALQTPPPITLNTTALTYVQVDAGTAYTQGKGIVISANSINFGTASDYTQYSVPYCDTTGTIAFTEGGTSYAVLRCDAAGVPHLGSIDLTRNGTSITGTLGSGNGGTGNSTVVDGDILYGSGGTWGRLPAAAAGNVLLSGLAPSWGKVDVANHTTGTIPVVRGGTGVQSFTVGGVLYGDTLTSLGFASGTPGYLLQVAANGKPSFVPTIGDFTIGVGGSTIINAKAVTFSKLQDVTGKCIVGRMTADNGVLSAVPLATLASELSPFISTVVTLTGAVTGTGNTGSSIATTLATIAGFSILGVPGGSVTSPVAITATDGAVLRRAGSGAGALAFGMLDLANGNSFTGVLPNNRGGTGTNVSLTFPIVPSVMVRVERFTVPQNTSTITFNHSFGTKALNYSLVDSNGEGCGTKTTLSTTQATLEFARPSPTAMTFTLEG